MHYISQMNGTRAKRMSVRATTLGRNSSDIILALHTKKLDFLFSISLSFVRSSISICPICCTFCTGQCMCACVCVLCSRCASFRCCFSASHCSRCDFLFGFRLDLFCSCNSVVANEEDFWHVYSGQIRKAIYWEMKKLQIVKLEYCCVKLCCVHRDVMSTIYRTMYVWRTHERLFSLLW